MYESINDIINGKSLIIYGSGKIAANLIEYLSLNNHDIVCVLDRYKLSGDFSGITICDWTDISEKNADILIIAASDKFEAEIFFE